MLKKFSLSGITKTVKKVTQIGLVVMAFVKAFEVLSAELEKISGSGEVLTEKTETNE